jgi:hypothetical protein
MTKKGKIIFLASGVTLILFLITISDIFVSGRLHFKNSDKLPKEFKLLTDNFSLTDIKQVRTQYNDRTRPLSTFIYRDSFWVLIKELKGIIPSFEENTKIEKGQYFSTNLHGGVNIGNVKFFYSADEPYIHSICIKTNADSLIQYKSDSFFYASFTLDDFSISYNCSSNNDIFIERQFPRQNNRCSILLLHKGKRQYFLMMIPNGNYMPPFMLYNTFFRRDAV